MKFLSKISNKRRLSLALILILVCFVSFLILRNFFKADTAGSATISGTIYGQDTKAPLPNVSLTLSSVNSDSATTPITVQTNSSGQFTINQTDSTFTKLSVTEDKYWDINGAIVNPSSLANISLNIAMKAGFGSEDAEFVALKSGQNNTFGLSLKPFNDNPIALTTISPTGNTYTEKPAGTNPVASLNTSIFYAYSPSYGNPSTTWPTDTTDFSLSNAGTMPVSLTGSTAVYSPDTDKYYIIGGTLSDSTLSSAIYEYDRSDPNNIQKVADLPYGVSGSSAIYVPRAHTIYIFGGSFPTGSSQYYFSFTPQNNYTVNEWGLTRASSITPLLVNGSIYLFQKNSSGQTSVIIDTPSSSNCGAIHGGSGNFSARNAAYQTGGLCDQADLEIPKSGIPSFPITDFTPYYSSAFNKIYLIGGKDPNGNILNTIYQIDPNNLTAGATLTTQTLPYPVADGIVRNIVRNNNNNLITSSFNVIGGTTTNKNGNTPQVSVISLSDQSSGLEASNSGKNFSYPTPLANTATAQDNSNHIFIFPSQTSQPIQEYTNSPLLTAGQIYWSTPTNNVTLSFYGRSQDTFSYTVPSTYSTVNAPPILEAIPSLTPTAANNISIKDGTTIYTYEEAIKNGLISTTVNPNWTSSKWLNDAPTIYMIDPKTITTGNEVLNPGDYVAFTPKKSGLVVNFTNIKSKTGNTVIPVDDLVVDNKRVTLDDINLLAMHKDESELTPDQNTYLSDLSDAIDNATIDRFSKLPDDQIGPDCITSLSINGKAITHVSQSTLDDYQSVSADISKTGLVDKASAQLDVSGLPPSVTADLQYKVDKSWTGKPFVDQLKAEKDSDYQKVKVNYLPGGKVQFPRDPAFRTINIKNVSAGSKEPPWFNGSTNDISWNRDFKVDSSGFSYYMMHEMTHSLRGIYTVDGDSSVRDPHGNTELFFEEGITELNAWIADTNNTTTTSLKRGTGSMVENMKLAFPAGSTYEKSPVDLRNLGYTQGAYFWGSRLALDSNYLKEYNQLYINYIAKNQIQTIDQINNIPVQKYLDFAINVENSHKTYDEFWQQYTAYPLTYLLNSKNFSGQSLPDDTVKYAVPDGYYTTYSDGTKATSPYVGTFLTDDFNNGKIMPNQAYNITGYDSQNRIVNVVSVDDKSGFSNPKGEIYTNVDNAKNGRIRYVLSYQSSTGKRIVKTFYPSYTPDVDTIYGITESDASGKVKIKAQNGGAEQEFNISAGVFVASDAQIPAGQYTITYTNSSGRQTIKTIDKMQGPYFVFIADRDSATGFADSNTTSKIKITPYMTSDDKRIGVHTYSPVKTSAFFELGNSPTMNQIDKSYDDTIRTENDQLTGAIDLSKTYYLRTILVNEWGSVYRSGVQKVVPISNIKSTNQPDSSVKVSWDTSEPRLATLEYGTTTDYSSGTQVLQVSAAHQEVTLTGLAAGQTWHFKIKSYANAANDADAMESPDQTFSIVLTTISNVQVTNITSTSATVSWNMNPEAKSKLEYSVNSDFSGSSGGDYSSATSQSSNLSGLDPSTVYYYRITAFNNSATDPGAVKNTGIFNTAPLSIFNVQVTDISLTSATIKWSTNGATSGIVNYGTSVSYGSSSGVQTGVTHSVTLTGLNSKTTYYYQITAYLHSPSDRYAVKNNGNFNTLSIIISNIQVNIISATSATISWNTDLPNGPAKGIIDYGKDTKYGSTSPEQSTNTTQLVTLTSLTPNVAIHYKITAYLESATDSSAVSSDDQSFIISNNFYIWGVSSVYQKGTYPWSLAVDYSTSGSAYCQASGGTSQGPAYNFTSIVDTGKICKLQKSYTISCYQANTSPRIYAVPVTVTWGPVKPHSAIGSSYNSDPTGIISANVSVTDFAEETFKIHVNGSFSGRLGYYPTGLNSVSGYIFPTGGYTSYLNAGTRYVNFSGTDSVITLTDLPPGVNYHYFIEPTETDFPDISGNSQCYDVSDDFSTNDLGSGTPHVPVKPIVWGPDHAVYDVCDNNYQFDLTDDLYNAPYNRILKFPDIARVQMTYGIYSKDILVGTAQGDVLAYSRPPGYGQGLRYIVPAPLDHSHSYKGLGYDFTLTNGAIYHMDYGTPPNYTNVKYASPYAPDHCPISNVINVLTVTSQSDSTATLSYSLPSPVTNSIAIPAPSTAIPTDASGTEIQYGLSSTELNQNYITPKPTTTAQTVIIPNLKTRTYYYRIVYSDKANNKFYSQIYTLKHGNKYIRFVNDLVGNSWDWARKLVKK